MTQPTEALIVRGAPGSPYTRKLLACLRYRHIPYRIFWGDLSIPLDGYPAPKVRLAPTVYRTGANGQKEALIDTSPMIREFEHSITPGQRSLIPSDPLLAFLNELIEDYADEWLTKAMFHYRWFHKPDRQNIEPLLIYWATPTITGDAAAERIAAFSKHQYDRLYVVGSNEITARTIENSYARLVQILDALIPAHGFVLGGRPASADFALFGQLTQLVGVEPTPAAVTRKLSPRLVAWVDRMEDMSGVEPQPNDWLSATEATKLLHPLLKEVGRVYAPFLNANWQAAQAGQDTFETQIDGRSWQQPTFPYQAKCRRWLREAHAKLDETARTQADAALAGTGCETLFAPGD